MQNVCKTARLPLYGLGLVLLFAGARYFPNEGYSGVLEISGFVVMSISLLMTWLIAGSARKMKYFSMHKSWRYALIWQALVLVGSTVFILYVRTLGASGVASSLLEKSLLAGWILCYIVGFCLAIGLEMALKENGNGEFSEPDRVRRAGKSWLTIGLLLSFLICINFAGAKKDQIFDWSYLKTTQPSDSSKMLALGLTEDVKISIFYPKGNVVLPYVYDYFHNIAEIASHVIVRVIDKDFEPGLAERLKVAKNGIVVLERGEQTKKIPIGITIRTSRKTLSKLDQKFQKAFLSLADRHRVAYFMRGHGELTWMGGQTNPLKKIGLVEAWLRNQSYKVKSLDVASGSATRIPGDASIVIIAGPSSAFSQAEADVLEEYLVGGGRALVLFEVDSARAASDAASDVSSEQLKAVRPLEVLLAKTGIEFSDTPLADVIKYLRGTKTKLDHSFLFTNSFTSHASVSGLNKHDEKIALFVIRSGSLNVKKRSGVWTAFETVRSLPTNFKDENRNLLFDSKEEKRQIAVLGAAARILNRKNPSTATSADQNRARREGRILAFADATVISDAVIRNPGNMLFLTGSLNWLIGEADATVVASSEQDIKIQHSRDEDVLIFYGSVFFMPFLILMCGVYANRKRKTDPGELTNRSSGTSAKGNGNV